MSECECERKRATVKERKRERERERERERVSGGGERRGVCGVFVYVALAVLIHTSTNMESGDHTWISQSIGHTRKRAELTLESWRGL